MPRLPQVNPGQVVPLRPVRPDDLGSGVGQAAYAGAAADLGAISARLIGAEREAEVARAEAGYGAKLAEFVQTVEQNPDVDAREQQFEEGRKALSEEFRSSLRGGPQYQAAFDAREFQLGERAKLSVREGVIQKRLDNTRGWTIEAVDSLFQQAETERDPTVRAAKLDAARRTLDMAEASGAFTATQKAEQLGQFEGRLRQADERRALAGVRESIRLNPAQALRDLHDPASPLASGLDEYQRQVAIDQAVSDYEQGLASDRAAANYNQAQRDRQEKLISAEAQKQADEALAAGDMGRLDEILDASRDVMTPEDRRFYLKRKAAGGGLEDRDAKTVPDVYVNLWNRAAAGQAIDSDADAYFRAGQLTLGDRDRLIKDSAEKRFGSAEKYLSTKLQVGIATEGMTGRTLAADAQRSMLDWRNRNPDATDDDAMAKAVELGNRYSAFSLSEQEAAMGSPKLGVGDRVNGFDIEATKDALFDFYAAKNGVAGQPPEVIQAVLRADPEYMEELALADRWRVTQERKAATQAPAPKVK